MTKIAVIGTHFVGKTTLVKKLSQKFKNALVIDEVVRSCPYPVNEMATLEAQEWILNEQIRREKAADSSLIITDRGLIDNFAYWLRVAEKVLNEREIEEKKEKVFEHSKSYDAILFLEPFEGEIKDDNFRSINKEWRMEMHERILKIVTEFKQIHGGNVFLLKGSEDEIFRQAVNIIKRLKTI